MLGRAPTMRSCDPCRPGEQLVEIGEPGGHAGDGLAACVDELEVVHDLAQDVVDLRGGVGDPLLGHLEHLRLGLVERLAHVVGLLIGELGDVGRHADQAPQQRGVLHDAGVAAGVRDRRRRCLHLQQRDRATDLVEQTGAPQLVGDGHRIDGLPGRRQDPDRLVDVLVGRLVELARLHTELRRCPHGVP